MSTKDKIIEKTIPFSPEEDIEYKKMLFKFDRSLSRKSLKDLAKVCCTLDDIISTQEGQDKKNIIAKYVPTHRIGKFNEYIALYGKIKKHLPALYAIISRLTDTEMSVQIILNTLKEQGSFVFEYNRLIDNTPIPESAVKRLTRQTTRHTEIKYNEERNRLYLSPKDIWEQLQNQREKYIFNMQEGKVLVIALDEFIEKYPIAEEFIPSEVRNSVDIIKGSPVNDIRIDEAFIRQWLRDIETVETEEGLKEWSSQPSKATGATLFPTFEEIEPSEDRLRALTGNFNAFEID